uniref:(northern house mosquito) hypothetical protein n=1 Tax=Culex pipiens TaxID=7175 RepID=A0A8D8BF38_CULPI
MIVSLPRLTRLTVRITVLPAQAEQQTPAQEPDCPLRHPLVVPPLKLPFHPCPRPAAPVEEPCLSNNNNTIKSCPHWHSKSHNSANATRMATLPPMLALLPVKHSSRANRLHSHNLARTVSSRSLLRCSNNLSRHPRCSRRLVSVSCHSQKQNQLKPPPPPKIKTMLF